jgi:hypothetical protein
LRTSSATTTNCGLCRHGRLDGCIQRHKLVCSAILRITSPPCRWSYWRFLSPINQEVPNRSPAEADVVTAGCVSHGRRHLRLCAAPAALAEPPLNGFLWLLLWWPAWSEPVLLARNVQEFCRVTALNLHLAGDIEVPAALRSPLPAPQHALARAGHPLILALPRQAHLRATRRLDQRGAGL